MGRFKKWADREYSKERRIIILFFAGIFFMIVVPFFLVLVSSSIDRYLFFPRFFYGTINYIISLPFLGIGFLVAMWAVQVQFSFGRGTPVPVMPTQKLVVKEPYTYCRNPMSLGTITLYLGVAIWIGSLSAVGLSLFITMLLMLYNKLIEERELEERFGPEYREYKRETPFLIPRLWKRN